MPRMVAAGMALFNAAMALSTALEARPLMTTVAPDAANPLAMAKPMPAVEPLTIAILLRRSMFIAYLAFLSENFCSAEVVS